MLEFPVLLVGLILQFLSGIFHVFAEAMSGAASGNSCSSEYEQASEYPKSK